MRRELRDVKTEEVVGSLTVDDSGAVAFDRYAGDVLRTLRAKLGDQKAAATVMADGWSNGYLYFAEATP